MLLSLETETEDHSLRRPLCFHDEVVLRIAVPECCHGGGARVTSTYNEHRRAGGLVPFGRQPSTPILSQTGLCLVVPCEAGAYGPPHPLVPRETPLRNASPGAGAYRNLNPHLDTLAAAPATPQHRSFQRGNGSKWRKWRKRFGSCSGWWTRGRSFPGLRRRSSLRRL